MKSRSHRIPSSSVEHKDDWVEESWTVDCVCGVNFDDGEEMVNCDECGVWVHTRCSRYLKTDKSFVCDKCKNNGHRSNHRRLRHNNNDSSEETEVAQLLVELPTKTLRRMDNNSLPPPPPPLPSSVKTSALTTSSRPSKLDIPIEERAHVQGVPGGGDPTLFSGVSSIFGAQLWKSTGYIPKKFNFRYREFPSWDEEDKEGVPAKENSAEKSEKQMDSADNGANALFSLTKLDVPQQEVLAVDPVGKGSDGVVCAKETGKLEGKKSGVLTPRSEVSKDRNLVKPPLLHFEKRKKEDLGNVKDKSGKKRARLLEKDRDSNKKIWSRTPGSMAVEVDPQCGNDGNLSQLSLDPDVVDRAIDAQKFDVKENRRDQVPLKLEESSKLLCDRGNTSEAVPEKQEIIVVTPNVSKGESLSTGGTGSEHIPENLISAGPRMGEDTRAPERHAKLKTELANGCRNTNVKPSMCQAELSSPGTSLQSQERAASRLSENVAISDTNVTGIMSHESKRDTVRKSDVVDLHKRRIEGDNSAGLDAFRESKDLSSGFGSIAALGCNKGNVATASPKVVAGDGTVSGSVGSSFPASVILMCKSSASENCNIDATNQNDNGDSKQKQIRESNHSGASTEGEDECRHEKSGKSTKEPSKRAASPPVQTSPSQLKKLSHAAIASKRTSSEIKDSMLDSSSHPTSELANVQKTECPMNIPKMSSALLESASIIEKAVTERPLNFQKVASALSESASNIEKAVKLSQKGEKFNQIVSQSSSAKANNASAHPAASSNSPSTLSDEELALLLHQELNSSPRVPRVPRMRHAGSLPQLASSAATSMLMKRTSSTGGKDHGLTFRRKIKGSGDMDDESKKTERAVSSSMDHRRQDSAFVTDRISKREADSGSGNGSYSTKKINAPSRTVASGSLSTSAEGNESNFSGSRLSPRVPSDDERVPVGRHTHRTLPGLLAEIMSEGKRMTYEELCNSVLPVCISFALPAFVGFLITLSSIVTKLCFPIYLKLHIYVALALPPEAQWGAICILKSLAGCS
ncbi:OLC1v1028836C5 [Oldenlandia corymbosa var. corymbosa]|uniref:OLC1v1028836C5 n=1 Tax=Oldenlandia corymbosa var. corymbosa TaxID=529605 RepID=A0AAV1CE91_OLDCO|nr:OLC1v1028836C5 [Oldenlandia corymbosa var. corymbosa]